MKTSKEKGKNFEMMMKDNFLDLQISAGKIIYLVARLLHFADENS